MLSSLSSGESKSSRELLSSPSWTPHVLYDATLAASTIARRFARGDAGQHAHPGAMPLQELRGHRT